MCHHRMTPRLRQKNNRKRTYEAYWPHSLPLFALALPWAIVQRTQPCAQRFPAKRIKRTETELKQGKSCTDYRHRVRRYVTTSITHHESGGNHQSSKYKHAQFHLSGQSVYVFKKERQRTLQSSLPRPVSNSLKQGMIYTICHTRPAILVQTGSFFVTVSTGRGTQGFVQDKSPSPLWLQYLLRAHSADIFVHEAGPRGDSLLGAALASFPGVEEVQVFEHLPCPWSRRRLVATLVGRDDEKDCVGGGQGVHRPAGSYDDV